MAVQFSVAGVPAPQGSKVAGIKRNGKAFLYDQGADRLKSWREAISDAGAKVMDGGDPLDGPLFCDLTFYLPKPRTTKFKQFPAGKPDVDKTTRAVLDALKFANVIVDDSRIIECHARKRWELTPGSAGVDILVMTWAEWLDCKARTS
jgi:Holliday junction resolvase RusA-like endonuclease